MNRIYTFIACSLVAFASCSGDLADDSRQRIHEGDPITLSFNLYDATFTKAGSVSTETMPPGSTFSIYAYEKGETDLTSTPLGVGTYEVQTGGKAIGNLTLYRGEYDLYLMSNNTNVAPLLTNGAATGVNGFDCMYNTLKNVTVQPETAGSNSMSVRMPSPFVRLGSLVELSVKGNTTQPVAVGDLRVSRITIKNVSSPLTYRLGTSDWDLTGQTFDQTYEVSRFTAPDQQSSPHDSDPVVLLPVDGTTPLEFEIVLSIYSKIAGEFVWKDFTYQAKAPKALLKGMKYKFEFTLTFFGLLNPGDMTISMLDYTNEGLITDQVGE